MKFHFYFLLFVVFFTRNSFAQTDFNGSLPQKIYVCSFCHGNNGNGNNPMFPRLAGQQMAYLETEMKSYRNHSRSTQDARDYMWGMARDLNDQEIKEIASYYMKQTPTLNTASETRLATYGKTLYENGIPSKNVPSCVSCHGSVGEGADIYPRLAGQFSHYLIKQMKAFREGSRHEPPHKMPSIAKHLTDNEIKAISAYLSTL